MEIIQVLERRVPYAAIWDSQVIACSPPARTHHIHFAVGVSNILAHVDVARLDVDGKQPPACGTGTLRRGRS
jgi:hypothetical protein